MGIHGPFSIGCRPSRIAAVMSGARNASGMIPLGYVRCTFSILARSEIDSTAQQGYRVLLFIADYRTARPFVAVVA